MWTNSSGVVSLEEAGLIRAGLGKPKLQIGASTSGCSGGCRMSDQLQVKLLYLNFTVCNIDIHPFLSYALMLLWGKYESEVMVDHSMKFFVVLPVAQLPPFENRCAKLFNLYCHKYTKQIIFRLSCFISLLYSAFFFLT